MLKEAILARDVEEVVRHFLRPTLTTLPPDCQPLHHLRFLNQMNTMPDLHHQPLPHLSRHVLRSPRGRSAVAKRKKRRPAWLLVGTLTSDVIRS